MANYNNITFGSIGLNVQNISVFKKQKTRKSVVGKNLIEANILGLGTTQWQLAVSGHIYGTTTINLGDNRASLEALDDCNTHGFVDGIHDGNYYVKPGTLRFEDSSDDVGAIYRYSMTLIEE